MGYMKTLYESANIIPLLYGWLMCPNPLFPAVLGELFILILIERYGVMAFLFEMYSAL